MTASTDFAPTPVPSKVLHSDALPSGTRLGEFEIVRLLGVGGFGMVYQAYDHSLHRQVAIKEYMPSALAGRGDGVSVFIRSSLEGASYQAGLQSFVSEARLLAQFDHPSLVKVFRFWEANNTAYMVMPLYTGMTLKQARSQMRRPPSEYWLRQVLWSVLEALKLLHGHGTVHRDVSPDNIFLQDSGPPVLLDLGAARRAIGDLHRDHTAVLKVNYAPIEQYADARDMGQGAWSDLYSLAAVVHGCLANDLPLPATFRLLRDRLPSVDSIARAAQAQHGLVYSPEFVSTLDSSLAIRPELRPQSVAAFAQGMGLPATMDMVAFDWRASMGADWQLSRQEQAALARPAPVDISELPTHFVYPPRPSAEPAEAAPTPVVLVPQAATQAPRRGRWGGLAVLLAAVAALAGVGIQQLWQRPAGPRLVQTPVIAITTVPQPAVEPAAEASSTPVALPPVLPAAKAAVRPSHIKAQQQAASATRSALAALHTPSPLPQLAEQYRDAKQVPVQLCADSNFFTRSMCLYRECQKPDFADLPVCVENNERLAASQRRR